MRPQKKKPLSSLFKKVQVVSSTDAPAPATDSSTSYGSLPPTADASNNQGAPSGYGALPIAKEAKYASMPQIPQDRSALLSKAPEQKSSTLSPTVKQDRYTTIPRGPLVERYSEMPQIPQAATDEEPDREQPVSRNPRDALFTLSPEEANATGYRGIPRIPTPPSSGPQTNSSSN